MVSSVYFFPANLVGYTRVLLLVIAFARCYESVWTFVICYTISEILDAVDGHVARLYNQTSRFGAVLDMLTDRVATMMLMVVLTHFWVDAWARFSFLFLISMDIVSHWAHMYASMIRGSSSHKIISEDKYYILRIYYHNKRVMGTLCIGNETFWVVLYALQFLEHPFFYLIAILSAPLAGIKNFINIVQLLQAMKDLVVLDEKEQAIRDSQAQKSRKGN